MLMRFNGDSGKKYKRIDPQSSFLVEDRILLINGTNRLSISKSLLVLRPDNEFRIVEMNRSDFPTVSSINFYDGAKGFQSGEHFEVWGLKKK